MKNLFNKIRHRIYRKLNKNLNGWKYHEKYQGLNIGIGTSISYENLDGIAPQLATIGKYCVFAPKSVVLTHDASLLPTTGQYLFKKVIIGDRVFVGYGAVIMPGVEIGDDVVIGSNAVVTKNIPTGSVVVGNPANIVAAIADLQNRKKNELITPPFDWTLPVGESEIFELQKKILGLNS